PAAVLPERLVHNSGRVLPGQFAGEMGKGRDPWFLEASPFDPYHYGAYPDYEFDFLRRGVKPSRGAFALPALPPPDHLAGGRLAGRLDLLGRLDGQRRDLDRRAEAGGLGRFREAAVALLTDPKVRRAFDLTHTPGRDLDRYG